MPRVSVVITCYNYGQYLMESINSVLDQTYHDFEVIVINDGSTDNTSELMDKFSSNDTVRYICQQNQGQPKAKNRGIHESSGEFIAFLDADDIWLSTKLERQMRLFDDTDVGVVYSGISLIDSDGKGITGAEYFLRRGNILDYIFIDNFVCFSSSVVRKLLLEEVGAFDESIPMGIDYDLWVRLAARCKFDFVDDRLVKYRTGHANLSKNKMQRYECALKIMNKALNDPLIKSKFSWYVPRLAWADTWSNMATYLIASGNHKDAWRYFGKATLMLPVYPRLWKRMIKCIIGR